MALGLALWLLGRALGREVAAELAGQPGIAARLPAPPVVPVEQWNPPRQLPDSVYEGYVAAAGGAHPTRAQLRAGLALFERGDRRPHVVKLARMAQTRGLRAWPA